MLSEKNGQVNMYANIVVYAMALLTSLESSNTSHLVSIVVIVQMEQITPNVCVILSTDKTSMV